LRAFLGILYEWTSQIDIFSLPVFSLFAFRFPFFSPLILSDLPTPIVRRTYSGRTHSSVSPHLSALDSGLPPPRILIPPPPPDFFSVLGVFIPLPNLFFFGRLPFYENHMMSSSYGPDHSPSSPFVLFQPASFASGFPPKA